MKSIVTFLLAAFALGGVMDTSAQTKPAASAHAVMAVREYIAVAANSRILTFISYASLGFLGSRRPVDVDDAPVGAGLPEHHRLGAEQGHRLAVLAGV